MSKPKTISATLTLENGKRLTVTYDVADEDDVRQAFPLDAPLLLDWMQEGVE